MRLIVRTALRVLAGACLLAGLASCGEQESKDSDRVADVIRTAATSTDPAHCTKLLTPRFVEQSEVEKGRDAIRSCREDAGDAAGNPKSVSISKVKVDEAAAKATVAFTGGDSDGQTLNVSLIKQGDQWKVDHIDSYARFDREKFLAASRRSLVRPPDAVPEDVADCITRRLGQLSDREIQRLVIEADRIQLVALVTPCIQQQQQRGTTGEDPAVAPRRESVRSA